MTNHLSRHFRSLGLAAAPFAAVLLLLSSGCATHTVSSEEAALLGTLQSSAGPAEKDAACARLKRIGTADAVPVLQALLRDPQLTDSARYVLEAMSAPEAGRALTASLTQTTGAIQVGIINSLGVRREDGAVTALAALARSNQPESAAAAVMALGIIGNDDALRALQTLGARAPEALRPGVTDALLRCAQNRLSADAKAAGAIFASLRNAPDPAIRSAAFRGFVLASGDAGVPLVCDAISGPPGAEQLAALQLVHELTPAQAGTAVARLLPRLDAPRQVAVIGGLAQRNSPDLLAAIAPFATSADADVKLAAITAMGELGDDSSVAVLAAAAASRAGPVQTAAREALTNLRRGQPARVMLEQLPAAPPAVQAELARALAARRERTAVPKLLALALSDSGTGGRAATIALARLGDEVPSAIAALVGLIEQTTDESRRALAADGLSSVCQHLRYRHSHIDAEPFVAALGRASVVARVALLPVCARIDGPAMQAALRRALRDEDATIRTAAIKAVCDTTDLALLPDLITLATVPPVADLRTAAVTACARLASAADSNLNDEARLVPLRAILGSKPDAEQQRIVLGALAEIPTTESLNLALPLLGTPAVADDAAQTVLQLVPLLPDTPAIGGILQQIAGGSHSNAVKQAAQLTLLQRGSGFGFITSWRITGPFRQDGRDYADLFEFIYKPETNDTQGVRWKALPASTGPHRGWLVDLRPVTGTQECVAYVQTWIHAPKETEVALEFGSDTPVKVWVDRTLVHTNPSLRALRPASDKVRVTLKSGWNPIMLKIAQRSTGAGFSFRALQPDGKPLEAVRITSNGPDKTPPPAS